MIIRIVLVLVFLLPQGPTTVAPKTTIFPGTTVRGGIVSAAAPSIVTTNAGFGFSTPISFSLGTLNSGDIVSYFASASTNGETFTMTVSGGCAAAGGNVTDTGPTNQGTATSTSQAGHLVITTGGACTLNEGYTGAGDGILSAAVIRGSSGLDIASAINNQNGVGSGANVISSNSVTTTAKDACVASTLDAQANAGTLTAGSTIAWTIGSINTTFPNGNETFIQSVAGSITGTFGMSTTAYTQTEIQCYKP